MGVNQIPITFALESKLNTSDVHKHVDAEGLSATNIKWDENESMQEDEPFMNCAVNCTAHLN